MFKYLFKWRIVIFWQANKNGREAEQGNERSRCARVHDACTWLLPLLILAIFSPTKLCRTKIFVFSTQTHLPIMFRGRFRAAAVTMAEQTVAAPPMSALIASIPDDGFSEMPPLEQTAQVQCHIHWWCSAHQYVLTNTTKWWIWRTKYFCNPSKCTESKVSGFSFQRKYYFLVISRL